MRFLVVDASRHFLGGAALRHFSRRGLERPLRSLRIKTITAYNEQSNHIYYNEKSPKICVCDNHCLALKFFYIIYIKILAQENDYHKRKF